MTMTTTTRDNAGENRPHALSATRFETYVRHSASSFPGA